MNKRNLLNLIIGAAIGVPIAIAQGKAWEAESTINTKPSEPIILATYPIEEIEGEIEADEPEPIDFDECEEIEKPYSDEDLELLAHLLNGEAGATWCSDEMVFGVGSVALNRVESEYFPNTLEEVIYQEGQYACTKDGNFDKEPSERCYQIAEELLLYGSVLPEDVVFQAEFKQGSEVYVKVQNMYFCRK